jgi:hypothetical protein
MKESRFASEILAAIRWLPRAIAHPHEGRTGNGPRACPPYDAYALVDGRFYAIEFKVFRNKSIQIDKIPNRQIEGLREARAAGATGAAFIFRMPDARGCPPIACVVLPGVVASCIERAKRAGRKSIRWEEIENAREIAAARSGGNWDITRILDAMRKQG